MREKGRKKLGVWNPICKRWSSVGITKTGNRKQNEHWQRDGRGGPSTFVSSCQASAWRREGKGKGRDLRHLSFFLVELHLEAFT